MNRKRKAHGRQELVRQGEWDTGRQNAPAHKRNWIISSLMACALAVILLMLCITGDYFRRDAVLIFTGDILLDRGVKNYIEKYGYDYPFEKISSVFKGADIVCGNLENPLTDGGTPSLKDPRYIFKAPPAMAKNLKAAGFNLLCLANNHMMDQGAKGLLDTMDGLEKQDIGYYGGGRSRQEAAAPVFIEINGITLGFLAYSFFPPEGYFYTEERPNISMKDISTLGKSVYATARQCDFLVVSFHWGREFEFFPDDDQKQAAYLAVDHGADLVIGHHPHVYQGVEDYKGKKIFYSLGNFIFDKQIPPGTDESVIVKVRIQQDGLKSLEILPVRIVNCQPSVKETEV